MTNALSVNFSPYLAWSWKFPQNVHFSFESKKRKVQQTNVLVFRIMCYCSELNFGLPLTKTHADVVRKY